MVLVFLFLYVTFGFTTTITLFTEKAHTWSEFGRLILKRKFWITYLVWPYALYKDTFK